MIRSLQYFQLQISRIIRVIIEELFNRCTCFIGPVTLEGGGYPSSRKEYVAGGLYLLKQLKRREYIFF